MSEGSEAREFLVILDGHAAVSVGGVPIAYLGSGSCFGERSLIDGRRRTATVTAAAPMRMIELGSARSVEPASRHAVADTEGSTASA